MCFVVVFMAFARPIFIHGSLDLPPEVCLAPLTRGDDERPTPCDRPRSWRFGIGMASGPSFRMEIHRFPPFNAVPKGVAPGADGILGRLQVGLGEGALWPAGGACHLQQRQEDQAARNRAGNEPFGSRNT